MQRRLRAHAWTVEYRSAVAFAFDYAADIARGSLFINTRRPAPEGTCLRVVLRLERPLRRFELRGRVVRVSRFGNGQNEAPGMRLVLEPCDAATARRMRLLAERRIGGARPDAAACRRGTCRATERRSASL